MNFVSKNKKSFVDRLNRRKGALNIVARVLVCSGECVIRDTLQLLSRQLNGFFSSFTVLERVFTQLVLSFEIFPSELKIMN